MYLLGDIHNQFLQLTELISESDIQDETIFQVGDFGLGMKDVLKESQELLLLNQACLKKNVRLIVIRGNHDDPMRFDGQSSRYYSNILFAPDYSVFKVEDKVVLVVGGGISVDRSKRKTLPYWSDEGFKFDESKLADLQQRFGKIDIVITHSCPSEFWPYDLQSIVHKYAEHDANLIYDLGQDRQEHSKLLRFLTESNCIPKRWFYGHFHWPYSGSYSGIKYQALDIFEMVELD